MMSPMAPPGAEARVREPGRGPEAGHAGHGAEERPAVRRDALGAVDQVGELGAREDGTRRIAPSMISPEELPVRRQELAG